MYSAIYGFSPFFVYESKMNKMRCHVMSHLSCLKSRISHQSQQVSTTWYNTLLAISVFLTLSSFPLPDIVWPLPILCGLEHFCSFHVYTCVNRHARLSVSDFMCLEYTCMKTFAKIFENYFILSFYIHCIYDCNQAKNYLF